MPVTYCYKMNYIFQEPPSVRYPDGFLIKDFRPRQGRVQVVVRILKLVLNAEIAADTGKCWQENGAGPVLLRQESSEL